jgi:hypothetical protein
VAGFPKIKDAIMRLYLPLLVALALPLPALAGGGYGGNGGITQDQVFIQQAPQYDGGGCYGGGAQIIQQAPQPMPYIVQQQAPVFIQRQPANCVQQAFRQQIVRQRAVYAQPLQQQVFRQRSFQRAPVFADAGVGGGGVNITGRKIKIKRSFGFSR